MRPTLVSRFLAATPRAGWLALAGFAAVTLVLLPALHLLTPPESALHVSAYALTVGGKILCYAIAAVALDLAWGYAFGMYLMRAIGKDGVYGVDLPDFMVFLDWKALPWYWRGADHAAWALLLVVLVPGLLALVFGVFAFRSRIRGVYFSVITQALTYAAMLLFFRNETGFGGNNGFTDFKRIFGHPIAAPGTRAALFAASAATLALTLVVGRYLVTSRFGRVLTALRDAEPRARFIGYEPLPYKLFVWTLSAVLCAIAGALYVPQVGIINPSEMSPAASIEIAIWVAVGGRGTLVGAAAGAALVNLAKSWFTVASPELWPFFLGLLFVLVTLVLPDGAVGLVRRVARARRSARARALGSVAA